MNARLQLTPKRRWIGSFTCLLIRLEIIVMLARCLDIRFIKSRMGLFRTRIFSVVCGDFADSRAAGNCHSFTFAAW